MGKGRTRLSAQMRIWQNRMDMDNAALAKKAGINVDTVYKIRRGDVGAGIDTIEAIADALAIDFMILLMPVDTSGE